MKNIDERLLLEHVRRINSIIQNTRSTENKQNIFDVGYEEVQISSKINEDISQVISLINYDRKKTLLESSGSENVKIKKMANLLYPDEMYVNTAEGEYLLNKGIFDGRDAKIGSEENKKFQNYASKLATPREWMTIFPYSMSKYYDPAYKKYPELYTKWKGHTAKEAESSMLAIAWNNNTTFKSFNKVDFSKTTDLSKVPGFTPEDEKRRNAEEEKRKQEWSQHLESGKYKSEWEDPEFVKNWMGEYDAEFYRAFTPLFFYDLAKKAAKKGYQLSPQWFKNWWENTAKPFIQDYGWIPTLVFGLGSVVALICGAPVLAAVLGGASIALDVIEIVTYIQDDDPFMAGLCMIFLLIPGDAIIRAVGGEKYMRKAADFLADWCLGPNARKGTKEMLKRAGEDLFGPIIEIGTNVKLYLKAMKKMIRTSIVSLLSKLRLKGLCKLIVWLIGKGWLLVKFLGKTVFTMGTLAITWGALCYYFGIKLPWQNGEENVFLQQENEDAGRLIFQWLNDPETIKDFPIEKKKIGQNDDVRIKMIQLALSALGYDQILESDLSHLSYADKSYGIPKTEEERKKRCSVMFVHGDIVGLKSDLSCKEYYDYFDPTKKTFMKMKPNLDISIKNTIKQIEKTKKEVLGNVGLDHQNKGFGLKFDVQKQNLSTGLNYYEKPKTIMGLNLGFTPGRIAPKLGYWDAEFDKMVSVFQKRNNIKIEDTITVQFITKLKELFDENHVKQQIIKYSYEDLQKEFMSSDSDFFDKVQKDFLEKTTDEMTDKISNLEQNNADQRKEIYDSSEKAFDVIPDVETADKIIRQINGFTKELESDTLNTPVLIYVPLED